MSAAPESLPAIAADIDKLMQRVAVLRNSLKDKTSMKYALESLPELIGEIQFRDLCEAVGLDCGFKVPTGEEFAARVRHVALSAHRIGNSRASIRKVFDEVTGASHPSSVEV